MFLTISRPCDRCNGLGVLKTDDTSFASLKECEADTVSPCKECETCGCRGEVFLFDNLDDRNHLVSAGGGMRLVDLGLWLLEHRVSTPTCLAQKLRDDAERDVGNDVTTYTDDQLALIEA